MIKEILAKLAIKEKNILNKEIFSPFVKGGNSIRLKVDGVLYTLKTPAMNKDGFGVFKATDHSNAVFARDADEIEVAQYLELLPKTSLILIYNIGQWLAYPYNTESFKKQFSMEAKLLSVRMVDNVEFLDTIDARFDGANFWFSGFKFSIGSEKKDLLREQIKNFKYSIPAELLSGITPEEKFVFDLAIGFHKEANKSNVERRLETEFHRYDASVDGFTERGGTVEVRWRDNKNARTYTSVLDKDNLSVITAGICLSGGDKKFDLPSLITVCREGHRKNTVVHVGNGGMEEDRYWDMYGNNREDDWGQDA